MSERGFFVLCVVPIFFCFFITIHFAEVITMKQALIYIDAVIPQAGTKKRYMENLSLSFSIVEIIRIENCTKQNHFLKKL